MVFPSFTASLYVIFLERYRMKPTIVPSVLSFASLLCFFSACPAFSATFSLNPVADACVTTGPSGNLTSSNYGSAGAISVAATGLPQGEFQSVLQFNLAGAKSSFDSQFGPGLWSLQSVTLQLTATAPNNSIFNPSAAGQFNISWMQNDAWTEGSGTPIAPGLTGITYSTLNSFLSGADEALGTFSFNGATNGNFTYSLALAPSFSADILSGGTLSLRMFAADNIVSFLADSRTFSNTSLRPQLSLSVIPEPGTVALGFIGSSIILYCRRKLHRKAHK